MDVEYKGKDTIIHNLKDFDLGQTMECGQCFHFQKIDDDEYDEFCDKLEHRMVDLNILPYD